MKNKSEYCFGILDSQYLSLVADLCRRTWKLQLTYPVFSYGYKFYLKYYLHSSTAPSEPRPPHYASLTIIRRHTSLSRSPLDEWSARRRDLYLTTHNNLKGQIFIPPAGFEPTIPASERPQTQVLDRASTETGNCNIIARYYILLSTVYCVNNSCK
jgi:hypothetical protein